MAIRRPSLSLVKKPEMNSPQVVRENFRLLISGAQLNEIAYENGEIGLWSDSTVYEIKNGIVSETIYGVIL